MPPNFVLLVLFSACLHALWNGYSKASRSPQIFFFWVGVFTATIAIVIFAIQPPVIPPSVRIYVVASGLVHAVYWFSLSQAYSSGDISYVYPIARSAPGFVPLFAFLFLHEAISARGLMGILCIIFSIYLLQQRGGGMQLKKLIRRTKQRDAIWAFSTLCTVIAYSLIDKKGMSEFHAGTTRLAAWQAVSYYLTQAAVSIVFLRHVYSSSFFKARNHGNCAARVEADHYCRVAGTYFLRINPFCIYHAKSELCRRNSAVFRDFCGAVGRICV